MELKQKDRIYLAIFLILLICMALNCNKAIILSLSVSLVLLNIYDLFIEYKNKKKIKKELNSILEALNLEINERFYIKFTKNGSYHEHVFTKDNLLILDKETLKYIIAPHSTLYSLIFKEKTINSSNKPIIVSFVKENTRNE